MTKSIAYCILIVFAALVLALSACSPSILSDGNAFLRGFVNQEFIAMQAVVLSITLGSIAQLHVTFNDIERRYRRRGLAKTKAGVRSAAYWLIGLFVAALVLVVCKPLLSQAAWAQSLFNGAALFILIWNVLVMTSIVETTLGIEPDHFEVEE
ncbi:MAG: hypothetical protein ABUS57_16680 [Pseudomonadota bacterium]